MHIDDTIAAIVTAPGEAGVAIVRVSGPRAFAIADQIFRCAAPPPSARPGGTFVYGHVHSQGEEIDEGLLLVMRAPHSFTAEDVVEIQGHGGGQCARRILRAATGAGARPAEPGEFTRRAFLNGRIDLLQAEAVLDLIKARSKRAAAAALEQLEGGLSQRFDRLYADLIQVAADIEATLDFPEEELPEYVLPQLTEALGGVRDRMGQLIASWDEGHLLRDGALIVISGKPNVGKSTLLNALLGSERAIVSPVPGTTRDTIEEGLVIDGIPVRLVDTAGLRETGCDVEREGIARTRSQLQRADLHLHVLDASQSADEAERAQIAQVPPARSLVVLNKTDLGEVLGPGDFPDRRVCPAALRDGRGLEGIRAALSETLAGSVDLSARPHAVISERHRRLLVEALGEIESAGELLRAGRDDLVAPASDHLRAALDAIGAATGKVFEEELLDSIFSRFCVGK